MEIKVINSIDKTAKTGRPYKSLEVESAGTSYKVNVFSNFVDFANIKQGSVIMGNLKQDGNYWNIEPDGVQTMRGGASGAYKEKVIGEAMQRKEQSIGKFQDNKEWSIMTASSMTNAVNLAIAEYKDKNVLDTLDQAVLKWRRFIIENWEINPKDYDPF